MRFWQETFLSHESSGSLCISIDTANFSILSARTVTLWNLHHRTSVVCFPARSETVAAARKWGNENRTLTIMTRDIYLFSVGSKLCFSSLVICTAHWICEDLKKDHLHQCLIGRCRCERILEPSLLFKERSRFRRFHWMLLSFHPASISFSERHLVMVHFVLFERLYKLIARTNLSIASYREHCQNSYWSVVVKLEMQHL
jgi:hypothetical protein